MCGLAGVFDPLATREELQSDIQKMTRQIAHRGPDHEAVWVDEHFPLAFGHRRLAILDLSPTGVQPMTSRSGRLTVVLNGEIYNFSEIRKELEALNVVLRGTSDTEILLEGMEIWGLEETLRKTVGMFALAVWDRRDRSLSIARDRLGEKPLYYGWLDGRFYFGSELKALRAHSHFNPPLNEDARAAYFALGYVPTPLSIYKGIAKLEPGTYLTVAFKDDAPEMLHESYWDPLTAVKNSRSDVFQGSFDEAVTETERLLKQSLQLQQVADVPVGAFLSGGIDSSTIVSLFQEVSSRPIQTFTIGFADQRFDESSIARQISQRLGTVHHEMIVTDADALKVIPELGWMYDEPFSDSSQIPTQLVSKFARSKVTVSISGDAGDELFGGYNRYFWGNRIWSRMNRMSPFLRSRTGEFLTRHSQTLGKMYDSLRPVVPRSLRVHQPQDKFRKLGKILDSVSGTDFYQELLITQRPGDVLDSEFADFALRFGKVKSLDQFSFSERMMFLDLTNYLVDDILVKVDRAAMSVGLETRVPMLDHRLVEWAWRLPEHYRIANNSGKEILKTILRKRIPAEWMDRPKMGFGVPLGAWLRGQLKEWAQDLMSDARLEDEGDFRIPEIRTLWQEHQSGKADHGYRLWNILMYLQWKQSLNRRNS